MTNLAELPLVLTVQEAADVLRLSKYSVRALVAEGRLAAVRAGRAIRIPRRAVLTLLGEPED